MDERKEVVITGIDELKKYIDNNSDGNTIISIVIDAEDKGEGGDT
jgi:hypothetical protein